jgi:hypothetical protein
MHLEFFFDGKSGCKRILRTQGRNSWTLRFLTENKFLSIKPLKIARQYLASARLIRVNPEPEFVNLLRRPGIDSHGCSLVGRYDNPI